MDPTLEYIDQQMAVAGSLATDEEKVKGYLEILHTIPCNENYTRLFHHFVTKILSILYGRGVIRPVIDGISSYVKGNSGQDKEFEKSILLYNLDALRPLLVSFEQQDLDIRSRLADIYQDEDDYMLAAGILKDCFVGADRHLLTDNLKFKIYMRIVRLYLEAGESGLAEGYLSRAALIRPRVASVEIEDDIHFRLSQARVLDSSRKFLEASLKYYEVSRTTDVPIDEDDRLACLSAAITCTILGPAGPKRSLILRRIYSDDRAHGLALFGILEKVYLERLLLADDIKEFSKNLAPHQKSPLPDGTTVLTRALIDHNLLSVSKIYNNVSISELALVLDLDNVQTESYTARMIFQGRLRARIDQQDDLIYFNTNFDSLNPDNKPELEFNDDDDLHNSDNNEPLQDWEKSIEGICLHLEDIVSNLQTIYPDYRTRLISA